MTNETSEPSQLKAWLEFISSLLWPAVVMVVLVAFKTQIKNLLGRIKSGKVGGAEFQFGESEPPSSLPQSKIGAAVSDSAPARPASESVPEMDARYTTLLNEDYFLFHATEVVRAPTSPGTGFFRVRVWVEAISDQKLKDIQSVMYQVWDDFPERQLTTTDRSKQFDVWLNANGEFPILARIQQTNGAVVWRSRYLDLPGRPKDPGE